MTGILAIETSADACSVALSLVGEAPDERFELAPRRHNRIIFDMLRDLVPGGDLRAAGVECLAYGAGPGSFTGLRIAASVVQGLAFSNRLPCVGVSTLATLAQAALEAGVASEVDTVLSLVDARVGEVYCGTYRYQGGVAVQETAPWVTVPGELVLPGQGKFRAIGDGLHYLGDFPAHVAGRLLADVVDTVPRASAMVPIARDMYSRGDRVSAAEVQPLYVRDEIAWKKLSEQGKQQ